jgi:hypothetical protein
MRLYGAPSIAGQWRRDCRGENVTVLIYHSVRVPRPFTVVEAWLLGLERQWMAEAIGTALGADSEKAAGRIQRVRTGQPQSGATALTLPIGCDLGAKGALDTLGGQLEVVWVGVNETQLGIVLSSGESSPDREVVGALAHDVVQRAMCDLLEGLATVLTDLPQATAPRGGDAPVRTAANSHRPSS